MVSPDARISTTLPNHPKTKKLIKRHGDGAAWNLICLFLWTAANRSDGDFSGMTDEDIELAANWPGPEGEFVGALAEVGFIDGEPGSRTLHDWTEHNPWAAGAKDRSEASAWAALCKRYGKDGAAERMPEYATRMRPACDPHAPRTKPQCPVSVTVSDSVTVSVTDANNPQASPDSVKALLSKTTDKLAGRELPPLPKGEIRNRWKNKILKEAQAVMPDRSYAEFADAFAKDIPWAKRKAEDIDRILKARAPPRTREEAPAR